MALVRPQDISLSINTLLNSSSDAAMLLVPLKEETLPSFKVVTDINDNVMYISRADIPFLMQKIHILKKVSCNVLLQKYT